MSKQLDFHLFCAKAVNHVSLEWMCSIFHFLDPPVQFNISCFIMSVILSLCAFQACTNNAVLFIIQFVKFKHLSVLYV